VKNKNTKKKLSSSCSARTTSDGKRKKTKEKTKKHLLHRLAVPAPRLVEFG